MKIISKTLAALLLAGSLPATRAAITSAEYYFNTDPGPGNGTPVEITNPGSTASLAIDIPAATIAALPLGTHWITTRVQDDLGQWSIAFTRAFQKHNPMADPPARPIIAAEYYIDTDPGPGNGTRIPASPGSTAASFQIDAPAAAIAALAPGTHWITARVQNEAGEWSIAFTRAFKKHNVLPDPQKLAARIEYQWHLNSVPIGSPVVLAASAPARTISFDFLASVRGLSEGVTYQLVATPYDTAGTRGFSETMHVKIETRDEDGNGLPDLWELNHNLTSVDPGADTDGDGLSNRTEFVAKTNPRQRDTSGDGLSDGFAVAMGLNPLQSYPQFRGAIMQHGPEFGLANESQIRALHPGEPLIARDPQSGKFTVRLGLAQSSNFTDWEPFPITSESSIINNGALEYSFSPPSSDIMFYRVFSDEK